MIGTSIAHYRVTAKLGAGGMGEVYRATDTKLGRDVALKLLPPAQTADVLARARMLREAQTASSLNHPHICHIYEIGEAEGHTFIAMELVEGRPLSASIPAGGMPIDMVIRYGEQMADALEHAHSRNVLHRDIKSSNVVVMPEGRVKILDFGLAKRISEGIANEATLSQVSPLTQAGSIAGTLSYLAPEVLSGHPADARSDLWALGVVLYEMASGTLPFHGRSSFEVSAAILRESAQTLPPRVPPGLRGVIQRCLAKEPAQRYQRSSEVRAALEALGSDISFPVRDQKVETPSLQPHAPAARASGGPGPFATTSPAYSTPGKPSPNAEANEYFDKATLFLGWGRQDLAQARRMLDRALELDPLFAEARTLYGFLMFLLIDGGESNDVDLLYRGHEELRRALHAEPDSVNAHASLAALYLTEGKKDAALAEIDKALQGNPEDLKANFMRMRWHWLNGETDEAIASARAALQHVPLFWPARTSLGQMLREEGHVAAAILELERAFEQDATNVWILRDWARAHLDRGDLRQAQHTLTLVGPQHRQNFTIRLLWAILLSLEGKKKEALREVDAEVVKYVDANALALATLAEFYACVGETEQALKWLDRAVRAGDERGAWFRRDPLLKNIREHPRFHQILESLAFLRPGRESAQVEAVASGSPTAISVEKNAPGPISYGVERPSGRGRSRVLFYTGLVVVLSLLGLGVNFILNWQKARLGPASSPATAQPAVLPGAPRLSTGGRSSANAEANAYFEKGLLFIVGQLDLPRAQDFFQRALELDPKFAEARARLAITHVILVETGISNDSAWLLKAEEEARRALQDDSESATAMATLAGAHLFQGRRDLALQQAERALRIDPQNFSATMWAMRCRKAGGDSEQALAMARGIASRNPTFWVVHFYIGDILRTQGDLAGAVREAREILEQDATNILAFHLLVSIHLDQGDLRNARMFLERARPADRSNYRTRQQWAVLYALERKKKDALKEMDEEVLKYGETNSLATLASAEFYSALGDQRKALDWLERAVRGGDERAEWFRRDPLLANIREEPRFKQIVNSIAFRRGTPSAVSAPATVSAGPRLSTGAKASGNAEANEYFEKAMLFMGGGQMDLSQARRMLERALELDAKFTAARATYGFLSFVMIEGGHSNDAAQIYRGEREIRRALTEEPGSVQAHAYLSAIYHLQGRNELALAEAQTALRAAPDDLDANLWLARSLWLSGETDQAIAVHRQNLQRRPTFWPARMNLGELLREKGDLAGAIREQQKVLEQDAKNIWATHYLAEAYLDQGNAQNARRLLERLGPDQRRNFRIRLAWATLLAVEGKRQEAFAEVDGEVLKYAEASAWVAPYLSEFYAAAGDTEKALQWLGRAVRSGDLRAEWFQRSPLLASIRKDPRFKQIMDSIVMRRSQK